MGAADPNPLWRRDEFLAASGGTAVGDFSSDVTGISIDSRAISPGDAFFAIKGDKFDGHAFAEAALENRAAIAICEAGRYGSDNGPLPRIEVQDVLKSLERVGTAARERSKGDIIAVTGSVGKTSTKEALRVAFLASGSVHASVASFNNHWGVPLSLARLPENTATGIFEVGMNHPNEISPLAKMIRPGIAIITTVEAVHMEAFDSVEEIAAAKAEIFDGLVPGGTAILNRDNPHFDFLDARARERGAGEIIGFGEHEQAFARLVRLSPQSDASVVQARIGEADITYKVGSPGKHFALNSLAVLAAIQATGRDIATSTLALSGWQAPKGRGSRQTFRLDGGELTLIDESYNANPASMQAALAALGQAKPVDGGRRIAVLGDMLELGADSRELHAGLHEAVAKAGIDLVFTAGSQMESLFDALPGELRGGHEANAAALSNTLPKRLGPGDIVMVKGSNGSRMMDVVAAIEARFESS